MQEFIIKPYKSLQFWMIFVCIYFQINILKQILIYPQYCYYFICFAIFLIIIEFLLWHCVDIRIDINSDEMVVKKFDKTQNIKWKDVNDLKIRYLFLAPTNKAYYIYFEGGYSYFPDSVENVDKLLEIIETQTKMKFYSEINFFNDNKK